MLKNQSNVKESNISLDFLNSILITQKTHFFKPDEDILYFIEGYESNEFSIMFEEYNPYTTD